MSYRSVYIAERTMEQCLEDRRGEVHARHLARQMRSGANAERFHTVAMAWLGRRLVAWGSGLQERYGATVAAPQPANRPAR